MPRLTPANPPRPPPLSEHICRTIYAANLVIQRVHKVVLDELGITYLQYLVLNLLWGRDNQSVSELSGQLELELELELEPCSCRPAVSAQISLKWPESPQTNYVRSILLSAPCTTS
ncbi:MarR family winged helix-turn-helix transcriptional regulator [Hyphomonas sp.]|uniref:MarR family winged helix-turn-helix transcriptional regulator n=1 Tax=Hyphomonas sp. TaxID=87 RepID=UPI001BCC2902|nr:MarR family winged helix-turn-helix transcriptional regulator [Hyphomonas sp.]